MMQYRAVAMVLSWKQALVFICALFVQEWALRHSVQRRRLHRGNSRHRHHSNDSIRRGNSLFSAHKKYNRTAEYSLKDVRVQRHGRSQDGRSRIAQTKFWLALDNIGRVSSCISTIHDISLQLMFRTVSKRLLGYTRKNFASVLTSRQKKVILSDVLSLSK